MTKHRPLRLVTGSFALTLALIAFVLGSAPFTPALALLLLALPLALLSGFMGAWRLAVVTLYFSTTIGFVVFLAGSLSFRIDYLLASLGIVGLVFSGALFYNYKRSLHLI